MKIRACNSEEIEEQTPEELLASNIRMKGILVHGSSGIGKTMMIR